MKLLLGVFCVLAACAHDDKLAAIDAAMFDASAIVDGSSIDLAKPSAPDDLVAPVDAPLDASDPSACTVSGAPGECIEVSACQAEPAHTPYAGHCPGVADIQCCIVTPNTANDPPTPAGYRIMKQSEVTAEMTTWAVSILSNATTYPMFSTATRVFPTLTVLALVEWHPPDFQNGVVHRGVTLYTPL